MINELFQQIAFQKLSAEDIKTISEERHTQRSQQEIYEETLDILNSLVTNDEINVDNHVELTKFMELICNQIHKHLISKKAKDDSILDSSIFTDSKLWCLIFMNSIIQCCNLFKQAPQEERLKYVKENMEKLTQEQYLETIFSFIDAYTPDQIESLQKLHDVVFNTEHADEYLKGRFFISKDAALSQEIKQKFPFDWEQILMMKPEHEQTFSAQFPGLLDFLKQNQPHMVLFFKLALGTAYSPDSKSIIVSTESGEPNARYCKDLIHESTHYLADKLFDNGTNPYNNEEQKNTFQAAAAQTMLLILERIEGKPMPLELDYDHLIGSIKKGLDLGNLGTLIGLLKFIQGCTEKDFIKASIETQRQLELLDTSKEQLTDFAKGKGIMQLDFLFEAVENAEFQIAQQLSGKFWKQLTINLNFPDQDGIILERIANVFSLYEIKEHDREIFARIVESAYIAIEKGYGPSKLLDPLMEYWQENIQPRLTLDLELHDVAPHDLQMQPLGADI